MNYRGTIAYRSNLGAQLSEGFLHSVVMAWDFLNKNYSGRPGEVIEVNDIHAPLPKFNFHFMRGLSCMPDESANQIADTFLGDWVLMLDTDHVFAADAFYEMVTTFEENNLDVLVGFTQKRAAPYHPVIYKTDFNALVDFETIFPDPIQRQTLIPIDSSGAACLMVRRKVFDQIKMNGERPFQPRSKFNALTLRRDTIDLREIANKMYYFSLPDGRNIFETFSEDSSFFWRAKMLGFQAYCAPWIKFHHLATVLVEESMIQRDDSPIPK